MACSGYTHPSLRDTHIYTQPATLSSPASKGQSAGGTRSSTRSTAAPRHFGPGNRRVPRVQEPKASRLGRTQQPCNGPLRSLVQRGNAAARSTPPQDTESHTGGTTHHSRPPHRKPNLPMQLCAPSEHSVTRRGESGCPRASRPAGSRPPLNFYVPPPSKHTHRPLLLVRSTWKARYAKQ